MSFSKIFNFLVIMSIGTISFAQEGNSISGNKIKDLPVTGEEITISINFPEQTSSSNSTPNQGSTDEAGLGTVAALNIALAALPKALTFGANTIKRITEKKLEMFTGKYELRRTIVYPHDGQRSDDFDEITLKRSVKSKGEDKDACILKIKRLSGKSARLKDTSLYSIFQITEINLPISKAKIKKNHPYIDLSIEIEFSFINSSGEKTSQKSGPLFIPLIKVGENKNLANKDYYTERFAFANNLPSEVKISVTESNSSKAKFEEIEKSLNESVGEIKDFTEVISTNIIKEYIEKLKKEAEEAKQNNSGGSSTNDGGLDEGGKED